MLCNLEEPETPSLPQVQDQIGKKLISKIDDIIDKKVNDNILPENIDDEPEHQDDQNHIEEDQKEPEDIKEPEDNKHEDQEIEEVKDDQPAQNQIVVLEEEVVEGGVGSNIISALNSDPPAENVVSDPPAQINEEKEDAQSKPVEEMPAEPAPDVS